MNNLLAEFTRQAAAVTPKAETWLVSHGIPLEVLTGPHACVVGVARIFIDGNLYAPDPEGQPAIIVPVSYEYACPWFEPHDCVAWLPDDPGRLYRRTDSADILNPEAIERAVFFDEPLTLWSTPLAWLKAGLAGSVILDWRIHAGLYLDGMKILCDTAELAECLSSKVASERRGAIPTIRTREGGDHGA